MAPQRDKKKEKERTEKEKSKECKHCNKIHSGKCWTLNPKCTWCTKEGVKGTAAQNHTADKCGRNPAKKSDRQAAIRSGGAKATALAEGEVR